MKKNELEYRKYPAFINREKELGYLKEYINIAPESILFIPRGKAITSVSGSISANDGIPARRVGRTPLVNEKGKTVKR